MTLPADAIPTAPTALRLRISTDTGLGPTGLSNNGEVEDYFVQVRSDFDCGDLPAAPSGYEWGAVRFTVPVSAQPRGFVRWKVGPP